MYLRTVSTQLDKTSIHYNPDNDDDDDDNNNNNRNMNFNSSVKNTANNNNSIQFSLINVLITQPSSQ